MAFYNNENNTIVPEQRNDLKIWVTDSETGEIEEKDNPNVKPFEYISPEREKEIVSLLSQGYRMKPAEDGTVQLIPPAPKTGEQLRTEYENRVNALIREKYSVSQEFAIMRQQTDKPDEYAEYYAYCEQCKATAKAEIYGG